MRKILSFVLTFLLIFTSFVIYPAAHAGSSAVSGSDCFPTRKGNNYRDGIYGGTQINAPELIQTWEYKGKANLTNAPAVCGNRIYLAENSRMMTCIEYLTGKILWQVEDLVNFPVSTPTVWLGEQNQFVFVSTGGQIERESVLYCFDANTGTTMWKWEPNRTGTAGQICSAPTLVTYEDGLEPGQTWLIVGVNVSGGTALFALDAKTGVLMWGGSGIGLGAISRADPVVAEGKIFQLCEDGTLFTIDLKTKQVIHTTMLDDSSIYEFHNTPAYYNGVLYCASRGKTNSDEKGKIYMVETATGGLLKNTFGIDQFNKAGPTIFKNGDKTYVMIGSDTGRIYAFDANDLHMIYNVNVKRPITTDIIISGKYGLLGAANNFLAINLETGGTVFSQTLGNTITMHPVPTAGMVYVACNDAKLYAFSDHDDFVVDVLPRTDTIFSGNKKTYKVVITATMDFSSPMILRSSGLPTTIKATFSEPFVYPGIDEQEVELTIEADENAAPGNYICNIVGSLLGRERNTVLQIQIAPPLTGDFKMSVSSDQLHPTREIEAGDSISYQIKVESIGGFNAEVAFYVKKEGIPTSIDVMFMPDRLTPDGYVTAIISTDTSTPADKYTIEIEGHAGGKVRTTSIWFTVGGFDTDDWLMFQHNHFRTGQVDEPFPENPELRYNAHIPSLFELDLGDREMRIRTQAIVAFNMVYVIGVWESEEAKDIHESAVFALDVATGEPKWMYQFNKSVSVPEFDKGDDLLWPVTSTPAIDEDTGRLFAGSLDGGMYCFDAKTGSKIWSRNTKPLVDIRGPVLIIQPDNKGINSKRVFFHTKTGHVYCFSVEENDKKIWERTLPSYVYSGLTYGYNHEPTRKMGMILAPCHDGKVYSMNLETGADVWSSPPGVYEFNGSNTIAVDDDKGHFYVAGEMGPSGELWGNSQVQRRDIRNGDMGPWRATFGPVSGSPALFSTSGAKTVCHVAVNHGITNDRRSRQVVLWRLEHEKLLNLLDRDGRVIGPWDPKRNFSSTIVDSEAGSVVPYWDGTLFGFDKNGKQMFKLKTEHETKAHPTMARRMLFLPTEDGHLFAWAEKWGFGLAPETGSPVLCQGQPISLNIHFRSEIPLPSGVKFKVIQAPPDTVTSFTPETLGSSGVTSLFMNAGPGCPEGTHTVIIQAEGAGFRRATTFTVTVRKESPGDFTFIAEPGKIQIYAGEPAEVDFTIDAIGGFVGVVQLSVDGLPTGVLGSFSPIITTVPGRSKYKMKIAKNLTPGTYNLVFKAEGGCKTKTFPVILEVEAPVPGDYKAYLADKNDKDQVVWLGEEIEIPISIEFLDGYNLPVNFEILNIDDFDTTQTEFEFVPGTATETTTVVLKIKTKFTGREIDGKRVIVRTSSGRKSPKTQVQFFLTVKKTQGGFTIKPIDTPSTMQLTAGQYGLLVFEYKNTTKFYTSTRFMLEFDCADDIEYWCYPEKLAPSVHPQKVVILFRVPRTQLDNDAEALEIGYGECRINCYGIGGGLRVGSRPINMRIYPPVTNQRIYFFPEFKGLKNKSMDEVEIHVANLDAIKTISFDILYDPLQVEIIDVTEGPVMESDNQGASLPFSDSRDVGVCSVEGIRDQDVGPISGSGKLCTLKIRGTVIAQETSFKICNLRTLDEFNGYKPITGPLPDVPPVLRIAIAGNLPGDVNGDDVVDEVDLSLLRAQFGSTPGDENWKGTADFNEDGIVDGMDLIILCMNWGASLGNEGPVP